MRNFLRRSSKATGLPPGTLVHVGKEVEGPVEIEILDYDEDTLSERKTENVEECFPFKEKSTVSWLNVTGIHKLEVIEQLGTHFGLHPLVMEDIANTEQRPKYEDYEEYIYVVLKMLSIDETRGEVKTEQVSLILGNGFVISFQEMPGDVFDPVRDRIRQAKGRIRRMGADYLAYALLDSTVDGYFVVLEGLGDTGEDLQEGVLEDPRPRTLEKIHALKRQLIGVRKAIWPLREAVSAMEKEESSLIDRRTKPYVRDLYDHTIQVMDTVETFRELVSGMVDIYMNSISNRMNEVMKVLTIMASIFIPLTFIAGIYGMNFENMPELQWQWGYPAVLVVMLGLVIGMVWFFWKKDWI